MSRRKQLARLGLFDARVPRYTSYPTAAHFSDAVGACNHRAWLRALPRDEQISLYVHVPFCRKLCWFCSCRTQGTHWLAPVDAYVETLKTELRLLARDLPAGVMLSGMHWGGGTPTLLDAALIGDLAHAIKEVAPLAPGAEFSVEIDPNEIDASRLDALALAGMNRATIGVQDFDAHIQQIIGRKQSYTATADVIRMLRDRGVVRLDADILYGLPDQTGARITDSVQKLLSLGPDRVALYGYVHAPWMARRQLMIPSDILPLPAERLDLLDTARKLLVWDGYTEIGIDHFVMKGDALEAMQRAGRLRCSIQGFTDDRAIALVGVGASAISHFPHGYTQNASATSAYAATIRDGRYATSRGHSFAGEDRLRARLIEMLLCDFRIDRAEILSGFDIPAERLDAMLCDVNGRFDNILMQSSDGLRIPRAARPLARMIARGFDSYHPSRTGHNSAV